MNTLAWWPHTRDTRVASYRLRCEQIVDALRSAGHPASLYEPGLPAPHTLVLSKRYDDKSLTHALALRERAGTRLVLDLCDNHFHFTADPDGRLAQRADRLRTACRSVDLVIACSDALATTVQHEAPGAQIHVVVDAAEPPHDASWRERLRTPAAELQLRRLRRELNTSAAAPARRLVWFGNHGSPGVDGGMSDLGTLREHLERAHSQAPASLTVISNNEAAYRQLVADWHLPTHYLPWVASTFSSALRLHTAAVIPIQINPFTVCKTANRVLTATLHGLNVIADTIPSYEAFAGCTMLKQWPLGLGAYLQDSVRRGADLHAALAMIKSAYQLEHIVQQWRQALGQLRDQPHSLL